MWFDKTMSESIKNIATAQLKVQKEIKDISKDSTGYGYNYTSFDKLVQYLRPFSMTPGLRYSVGLNDGKEFRRVAFVGTKLLNGKPMMCFKTVESVDLTVNPSYMAFIVEDVVEIIDVTLEEDKLIK